MDASNPVIPDDHKLARRLRKMTENLRSYDGLDLNFKVYLVKVVHAFACADGSVRARTGPLDVMDDNEVLGK